VGRWVKQGGRLRQGWGLAERLAASEIAFRVGRNLADPTVRNEIPHVMHGQLPTRSSGGCNLSSATCLATLKSHHA
jgi:hypothetical protein